MDQTTGTPHTVEAVPSTRGEAEGGVSTEAYARDVLNKSRQAKGLAMVQQWQIGMRRKLDALLQ